VAYKDKEKQREYSKAYYEANKEAIKAYYEANKEAIKAYYEANKEDIAKREKAWYEANKEAVAKRKKAYHKANKEAIAERNKTYYEANKEAIAARCGKRRALKRNAVPKFLRHCQEEKKRLQEIYRLRQVLSDATGIVYHVDHMWPLSDGGPHWSGNLQVIPAFDNLSKHATVDTEIKKTIKEGLKYARQAYKG
jgi:actin-related protein